MGVRRMRKLLFLMVLGSLFMLGACGTTEKSTEKPTESKSQAEQKTENQVEKTTDVKPIESTEHDTCVFCNMKVYGSEHEMGVFTAQAIDANGKNVFFDDSGCLLNAERKNGEKYKIKWVRDYQTKEWIDANTAVLVKANIQTPMKYGYAFFKDEASADQFIKENSVANAVKSSWQDLDEEANKRYMKKMKMQQNGKENSESHMESDHNKDDGHGH